MAKIQQQFNSSQDGTVTLPPGEYEGPLIVNRSCTVDGRGSTLWYGSGPVLLVSAPRVTVRNLRVEVTGDDREADAGAAVRSAFPDLRLENVEVRGSVIGLPGESESWQLPGVISLGEFAAESENSFVIDIQAPAEAALEVRVNGLDLHPDRLYAGRNSLLLTTGRLRSNSVLFGEIMVFTSVARRIYVTGKALAGAPVHTAALPEGSPCPPSPPVRVNPSPQAAPPPASDPAVPTLQKGSRISASRLNSSQIGIAYGHRGAAQGIEVDCYCFMLGEDGRVSDDDDLIFFGHTRSRDGSVTTGALADAPSVTVDLDRVSPKVSRIAVCFSVYGDDPSKNFSAVTDPEIRVFGGDRECFRFGLHDLTLEKTAVAAEIYRYKGQWKINFVGAGYRSGLRHLCRSYGVNVI